MSFTSYNSKLDAIIITFRATEPLSLKDWSEDADFVLVPYGPCEDKGCKIHKGFLDAYKSIQE